MTKILSYRIEAGKVILTGDSSKQTLVVGDKEFMTSGPIEIRMVTEQEIRSFYETLLQANHQYEIHENKTIVIDGIFYQIKPYELRSVNSNNFFYIPNDNPRNIFKIYCEFVKFHHEEQFYLKINEKIDIILTKYEINKTSHIERTDNGILITVKNYSLEEKKYPNFQLLLDSQFQLKFLHFLEEEGEYYSNGEYPLKREHIQREINKQQRLLEKFDKLSELFNINLS